VNIDMTGSVYYGLAVTGHAECQLAKAEFDNLTITKTLNEIPQTISYHALKSSVLHSTFMKEDSKIVVGLPYKYDSLQSTRYPILYYLDRNNPTYPTLVRDLSLQNLIPNVITVGVGYFSASKRDSDYTVNFKNFHPFLRKELLPYIENHWRADTLKRTISGHSFGGLACLNTMFTYTNYNVIPFRNIVASSPSIWWPDGQQAFNYEQNLRRQTSILPVNLYMSIGTNEDFTATSNFSKMAKTIVDRNYDYLNFMRDANEGKTQATNADISFREGLIWVLNQKVISPNSIATNVFEQKNSDPVIYPNPTTGEVNIVFGSAPISFTKLELINIKGITISSKNYLDQSSAKLDLSKFPKGIYLLRLTIDGKIKNQKISLF
jgi:predicted alpha/beta superfamily hydrolase